MKALVRARIHDLNSCTCTFRNAYTGNEFEKILPIKMHQVAKWLNGELIQVAMPNLTAAERELFLTGVDNT